MNPMQPSGEQIASFKKAVIDASHNPQFIHHPWFVTYHLDIVDRLADELLAFYPEASPELVKILVWLHDYGKTIDFDNQYELTPIKGREKLLELGFDSQFVDKVIEYVIILDKKLEQDIREAPIEVQIVSSADGCSHFVGPFMYLWWWENAHKPFTELMSDNRKKAEKDWSRKIVLPEARHAFEKHYTLLREQSGDLPKMFLS